MAKKNETYNINAMRPALQKAYQNGNRRMISAKDAKEAGVSEGYFEMYRKLVADLYNAAANYCRVKNSPTATDADRAAALEPIWGCWKALLQCGEKAKDQRDFRPSEHDIANRSGRELHRSEGLERHDRGTVPQVRRNRARHSHRWR